MTRSAHASCWIARAESDAMWRLYCNDPTPGWGVVLRSKLAKIEASVQPHDLNLSPISFRNYHESPAFTDDLDVFMHEGQGFEHEREVRLLEFDQQHYLGLAASIAGSEFQPLPPAPPELPDHIFLDWSPLDHVDVITIRPHVDEAYELRARTAIESMDPSAAGRIELPIRGERRYALGF
jgi:hypothetical protein